MLQQAVGRVVGVDAVVTVADRREVRPAVAVDARPEEAVVGVVAGGQVLDRDAVGAEHPDAVVEFELTVEDHLVAVEPTDRQLVGLDVDGLVVDAGRDQHEVAG